MVLSAQAGPLRITFAPSGITYGLGSSVLEVGFDQGSNFTGTAFAVGFLGLFLLSGVIAKTCGFCALYWSPANSLLSLVTLITALISLALTSILLGSSLAGTMLETLRKPVPESMTSGEDADNSLGSSQTANDAPRSANEVQPPASTAH